MLSLELKISELTVALAALSFTDDLGWDGELQTCPGSFSGEEFEVDVTLEKRLLKCGASKEKAGQKPK